MKSGYSELEGLARKGRWLAISTVAKSGAGHVGGPFSAMDILTALFFRILRIDPQNPKWAARDRFILSKGHSSIGLYVVMALRGYFPIEELKTFDKGNSRLQGHPDVTKLPGTGCLVRWFDSNNNVLRFAPIAIRSLFHPIYKIRFTDI